MRQFNQGDLVCKDRLELPLPDRGGERLCTHQVQTDIRQIVAKPQQGMLTARLGASAPQRSTFFSASLQGPSGGNAGKFTGTL